MLTETETKTWALCPACNGRVGTIDHLDVDCEAGAWFCDGCGRGWWLTRTADGVTHREHGEVKERTTVTLILPPQPPEVAFTLDAFRIVTAKGDHVDDAYFYDEHTCPTNWLRNVTEVSFNGNEDPHGLWRWVSTAPAPDSGSSSGGRTAASKSDDGGSIPSLPAASEPTAQDQLDALAEIIAAESGALGLEIDVATYADALRVTFDAYHRIHQERDDLWWRIREAGDQS